MNAVSSNNTIGTNGTNPFRLDASKQSAFSGVKAGDIISGTLSAIEGKKAVITMENGSSFQVDANSIAAEIGQKISFEVADVHGNTVVMKQINEQKQEEIQARDKGSELTGDELLNWVKGSALPITGRAFESSKIVFEELSEQNAKISEALNKIRRDILHSVNSVSSGAVSLLAANGISPSGVTVSMLSEAIKSAVSSGIAGKGLDTSSEEEIQTALESYANNNQMAKNASDIIEALLSEKLPPTETNINGLAGVCRKLADTEKMSFEDKIGFLRRQQEPTVNNLFTAMHSAGGRNKAEQMTDAEWKEVRPAAEKYMDTAGLQKNSRNLSAARALIANDIPVTEDNISFLNGTSKRLDTAEILKKAARRMAEGKSPLNVNLYRTGASFDASELLGGYKDIIENLPKITDSAVSAVVESGQPVTVSALIEAQRNGSHGNDGQHSENSNHRERFIAERIKIEELRLRLTIDAASQMARAGVSIDTMELQGAIDELKRIEDSSNASALKIAGAAVSPENIAEMSERSSKVRGLSNTYDSVKRAILKKEIEFTAEKVAAANESAREKAARDGYEALSTAPNAKFGDTVQKALAHVENLLETLGIEAVPDNIKAARSLVRTGVDVTRESIEAVKAINNKLEYVVNNLHPIISAQMIRDGFNPLTAHIDEAISYIEKFNEIYGEPPLESVEKAILAMDKNGELSKTERASLIGAYRMLSAIEKNEMASSAVIAKSGKSLTLENLMEAGKYYDKSRSKKSLIDRTVDDNDALRELIFSQATIKEQIESAYKNALSELSESGVAEDSAINTANANNLGLTAENMSLIKAVSDNEMDLTGENLNTASNIKYDIDSFIAVAKNDHAQEYLKGLGDEIDKTDIRALLDGMKQFMADNSENEAMLNSSEAASFQTFKDDVKSIAQVSPQQIAWMLEMNLPLTVGNIKAVCGMSNDRNYLGKRIEEINRLAEEIAEANLDAIPDTDLRPLVEGGELGALDNIGAQLEEIMDKALDSDSPKKIDLLRQASVIENAAKVMRQAGGNYYQIPVKLNDKIGSLNVFVLNREADADNMSAFIQLDMTELGVIQGSVNIKDGFADIIIGTETERTHELLAGNAGVLDGYISELGLNGYTISFKHEEGVSRFAEEAASNVQEAGRPGAVKASDGLLDIKL